MARARVRRRGRRRLGGGLRVGCDGLAARLGATGSAAPAAALGRPQADRAVADPAPPGSASPRRRQRRRRRRLGYRLASAQADRPVPGALGGRRGRLRQAPRASAAGAGASTAGAVSRPRKRIVP